MPGGSGQSRDNFGRFSGKGGSSSAHVARTAGKGRKARVRVAGKSMMKKRLKKRVGEKFGRASAGHEGGLSHHPLHTGPESSLVHESIPKLGGR